MPVVQCPNCDKKLNLREPKPGKKLRCPGCEEPFTPFPAKASGQPQKKKRPAPVDDFEDDEEEEGFEEPAPRRRSKSAAAKSAGGKGGAKTRKKGGAGGKSKLPLFIGVGVLGVALAGGVTWMLMGANADSGGDTTAAAAPTDGESSETDMAAAAAPAENSGGGAGGHGGGSAMPATSSTNAAPAASDTESPTPTTKSTVVPNGISLQWLPQQSEGMAHINFDRLLAGPVGQLLQSPLISGPLQQFRDQAGFGLEDLDSLTVGIGGVKALMSGQPPTPESLPAIGVLRLKKAVDAAKLLATIPGAQSVNEGALTLIRLPGERAPVIWFADSSTAIVGVESAVKQAAASSSRPTTLDTELLNNESVMQVLFSPQDPAIFQHPNFQAPPQGPPGGQATVQAIRQHVTAVSLSFDLTNDIGVAMAARCRDADGAQAMKAALTTANKESAAQADGLAQSPQAAMMGPIVDIIRKMTETTQITAVGTICRSSGKAADEGQKLVNQIPMLIGQAMAQGMMQGRTVAQSTSKNNLKQIGLAMHNFHDQYGRFPNAAGTSPTGEKWLSWRVHLLPFLDQQDLYEQFNLEEPWDSPTNRPLAERMPDVFRSPGATLPPGQTLLQTPVGDGTAFEGAKGFRIRDFTDGTSNTVLVVEVSPDRAVYWTQPDDFQFNPDSPLDGLGGVQPDGFQAVFTDGSVRPISGSLDEDTVKGIFTRNGGEVVSEF